MRLSLKYRIALTIFVLEAIMMAMVLWVTLGLSLDTTRQQADDFEKVLLGVVSQVAHGALLTEEYADIQPYLEKTLDDPRVIRAFLLDTENRVVAGTQPAMIGDTMPPLIDSDSYRWRSQILANATGPLGKVVVEFSDAPLIAANQRIRDLGLGIALTGMVVIALVGLMTGTILTSRLGKLSDRARQVSAGATPPPLNLPGNDELSDLGTAFDLMLKNLQSEQARTRAAHLSLEHQVEQRTKALSAANAELEAFSYSVSHDLRAPLRAIDGFSQALMEDYGDKFDDTAHSYIERVRNGAQKMGNLIDDMLQLSRISRKTYQEGPVDLSALVGEIITELRNQHPDRTIEAEVAPGLITTGDKGLLRIALTNLLDNAVKYSRDAPCTRIRFDQGEHQGTVCYRLNDNGTGFDMKFKDKLFRPFQRLHSAEEFPGTGIGLANVQRVIRRHGGSIWVESAPGAGTTFYFTLPQSGDQTAMNA